MEENLFEVVLINKDSKTITAQEAEEPCDDCWLDYCSSGNCNGTASDDCSIDFSG